MLTPNMTTSTSEPLMLLKDHHSRPDTVIAHREAAERAIKEMQGHLGEPLQLEDLARSAILSPFHFNRTFRKVAGIPPARFLYATRIQHAKLLILTTSRSILDICYEVGYNSLGTFTTRFTQVVGVSPTRLRKLARELTGETVRSMCLQYAMLLSQAQTLVGESAQSVSDSLCINGYIASSAPCSGPIFLGLFPQPIPEGRPAAGTVLAGPGPFQMGPVPPGVYYLLAAGITRPDDLWSYLLLKDAMVAVAGPLQIEQHRPAPDVHLLLRQPAKTDPPILVSLPVLLCERMKDRVRFVGD